MISTTESAFDKLSTRVSGKKSKGRIKVVLPKIDSREQAESHMNGLAATANAKIQVLAQMDEEILAIKKRYESAIGEMDKTIAQSAAILKAWAEAHPDEFPKDRKSINFLSGVLGFRTGTPKLALLNRKWTWEKCLAKAQELIPAFIRSHPELDKEALLNQRNEQAIVWAIEACGMKVTQDEGFYIEPKLTPATNNAK